MKYYFNKKWHEFTMEDMEYMYENEGKEADVYRYFDKDTKKVKALKIYKTYCSKDRLDEDTTYKLIGIPTKRFVMPEDAIYDERKNFVGQVMNFYQGFSFKNIGNMPIEKFIEEVKIILEDAKTLATEGIDIEDLNRENTIYTGIINLIDSGSFRVVEPSSYVFKHNEAIVKEYILSELLLELIPLSKKKKQSITKKLLESDTNIDILFENYEKEENVKSFTKRICK